MAAGRKVLITGVVCDNPSLIMVIGLKHVWLVNEYAIYINSYIFMILVGMYIQQNSRNLVSNNPEISIIRRLR